MENLWYALQLVTREELIERGLFKFWLTGEELSGEKSLKGTGLNGVVINCWVPFFLVIFA